MPELNWPFGYLYALTLMALVAAGMVWSFKRRGWLRREGRFDQLETTQGMEKQKTTGR
jgi:hypothetical protein